MQLKEEEAYAPPSPLSDFSDEGSVAAEDMEEMMEEDAVMSPSEVKEAISISKVAAFQTRKN